MKTVKGFKFITDEMKSKNGNITWKKNKWQKHEGKVELCDNGFHACKNPVHSLNYTYGNKWFIVEARGNIIEGTDKFVAQEMRIIQEIPVKEVCVEFAIACAKRCLKYFEKIYPEDKRPRFAIQAAEAWLKNPTNKNAEKAKLAARLAGSAGSAERSAWSAEWLAERSAWSAARLAGSAESAEWLAERSAWSAARLAGSAWSAARLAGSAWSAAWSEAISAADSAADSAAMSAEKEWQEKKLNKIIKKIIQTKIK